MRKSVKKILIVVMSIMLMLMFLATISYGAYKWDFEQFDGVSTGNTGTKIESAGATIIKIMQVIAIGVAILMLVATGIMYVLSATSDKKAEMKKHIPNYLVGVAFTFSAAVILEIVHAFIQGNINK